LEKLSVIAPQEIFATWEQDPEFAKMPLADKQTIAGNFFDKNLTDQEFSALPPERQTQIRFNFVNKFYPKVEFDAEQLTPETIAQAGPQLSESPEGVAPIPTPEPLSVETLKRLGGQAVAGNLPMDVLAKLGKLPPMQGAIDVRSYVPPKEASPAKQSGEAWITGPKELPPGQKLWKRIESAFSAAPQELEAKDSLSESIAEEVSGRRLKEWFDTGLGSPAEVTPAMVSSNPEKYAAEIGWDISKPPQNVVDLGVRAGKKFILPAAIAAGAVANPLGTALGLAGFEAVASGQNALIAWGKDKPYGDISGLRDLLPEDSSALTKDVVDAVEFLAQAKIAHALFSKGSESLRNWWRSLNVKERGLAVQTLDETIAKNPEMTEGEILRQWDNPEWRKQAFERRGLEPQPQKPVEPIQPPDTMRPSRPEVPPTAPVEVPPKSPYEGMTKKQLVLEIKGKGLTVPTKAKKADLVDVLKQNDLKVEEPTSIPQEQVVTPEPETPGGAVATDIGSNAGAASPPAGPTGVSEPQAEMPSVATARVTSAPIEFGDMAIPETPRRSNMIKAIEYALDRPIRVGRFRKRVGNTERVGIYKNKEQVIRLAKANDIETAVHEVGHHVQNVLGFSKAMPPEVQAMAYEGAKDVDREGFAEFLRLYVTQPTEAAKAAPEFSQQFEAALESVPRIKDALINTRNEWNVWQQAPSVAKVASLIRSGAETKKAGWTFGRVYTKLVEEYYPFKELVDLAESRGHKIPMANNPYVRARIIRGWPGMAEQWIRHQRFQETPQGRVFTGPGLESIVGPVESAGQRKLLDTYLVAKRGANNPKVSEGFKDVLSKEDMAQTIKDLEPQFGEVAGKLYEYQDDLLTYLQQAGRISQDQATRIRQSDLFYAPLYRFMEGTPFSQTGMSKTKFGEVPNPVKALKGSSRDVLSPTENMLYNTFAFINAAERNRVGAALASIADMPGMGDVIEEVPMPLKKVQVGNQEIIRHIRKADPELADAIKSLGHDLNETMTLFQPTMRPSRNEVLLYQEGNPRVFHVAPELYAAIEGMSSKETSTLVKVLSIPAAYLRAGATLSPQFMQRNPMKDQLTAAVQSFVRDKTTYVPIWDFMNGLFHILKKDDVWQKANAWGVLQGTLTSIDRDTISTAMKGFSKSGQARKYFNPLTVMQTISNLMEAGTRVGVTAKKLRQGGGLEGEMDMTLAGKDNTTDFPRRGASAGIQAMNRITAFFNANIQGLDVFRRLHAEHPLRAMATGAAIFTIPSLLLWAHNHDDPNYQELPNWRKISGWNFPIYDDAGKLTSIIWLPKPFEWGIIYGSLPELIMDSIYNHNPEEAKSIAKALIDQLAPPFIPTIATGPIEWWGNKSLFFNKPIVPRGQEDLPPEQQFGPNTSTAIRALADLMAKIPGVREAASPAKMENLVRNYTANTGKLALDAADLIVESLGIVKPPPRPEKTASDSSLTSSFVVRTPSSTTASIQEMYDRVAEMKREWEGKKQTAGVRGKGVSTQSLKPPELVKFELGAQVVTNLGKAVRDIQGSMDMTPEQKREKIDALYQKMTDVARITLGKGKLPERREK
jgi:hypothetical protein